MKLKLCEEPGHEWVGNQSQDCRNCGAESVDVERFYLDDFSDGAIWRYKCQKCGCRWVQEPGDPDPRLDFATHRLTILAPVESIEANGQHKFVCSGCAAKLAETSIDMGVDIQVIDMTRGQEVT